MSISVTGIPDFISTQRTPLPRLIPAMDRFQSSLAQLEPAGEPSTPPEASNPLTPEDDTSLADLAGPAPGSLFVARRSERTSPSAGRPGPATLMGGGWAVTFLQANETGASHPATFHFKGKVVRAVSATGNLAADSELFRRSPGGAADSELSRRSPGGAAAMAAYRNVGPAHRSLSEAVDGDFKPLAAQVDIFD